MREIKFRAWYEEKKKMLSWEDIETLDNNDDISFIDSVKYPEGDPYVYMQYTGLKDVNGKEIYGGGYFERHYISIWQ